MIKDSWKEREGEGECVCVSVCVGVREIKELKLTDWQMSESVS